MKKRLIEGQFGINTYVDVIRHDNVRQQGRDLKISDWASEISQWVENTKFKFLDINSSRGPRVSKSKNT